MEALRLYRYLRGEIPSDGMPDSPTSSMPPPTQDSLDKRPEGGERKHKDRKEKEKHKRERKEKKKRDKEHRKSKTNAEDTTTSSNYIEPEEEGGDVPNVTTDTVYTAHEEEPSDSAVLADASNAEPSQETAPADAPELDARESVDTSVLSAVPELTDGAAARAHEPASAHEPEPESEHEHEHEREHEPEPELELESERGPEHEHEPEPESEPALAPEPAATPDVPLKKKRGRPSKKDLEERARAARAAAAVAEPSAAQSPTAVEKSVPEPSFDASHEETVPEADSSAAVPEATKNAPPKKKTGRPSLKDIAEREARAKALAEGREYVPPPEPEPTKKKIGRPSNKEIAEREARAKALAEGREYVPPTEPEKPRKRGRPSKKDLEERAAAAAALGRTAEAATEEVDVAPREAEAEAVKAGAVKEAADKLPAPAPTPKRRGRPSKAALAERAALEAAKTPSQDDDAAPLASLSVGAGSALESAGNYHGRNFLPSPLPSVPLPPMLGQGPPSGTVNIVVMGGPTFSRLTSDLSTLPATKDLIRDRLKLDKTAPLTLAYVMRGSLIDLEDDNDFTAFERKVRSLPPWANEELTIHVKPPVDYKYESIFPRPPPVPSPQPHVTLESAEKRKRDNDSADEEMRVPESGSETEPRKRTRTDEVPEETDDPAALEQRYQELVAKGRKKTLVERSAQKELAARLGHKK